jgi:hypothetical protein
MVNAGNPGETSTSTRTKFVLIPRQQQQFTIPSTGGYLAKGRLLLYLFVAARGFPAGCGDSKERLRIPLKK